MARLLRSSLRTYYTTHIRMGSDQLGELGKGAGKGGGGGGSIREAGGAFGKKEAAEEERYFSSFFTTTDRYIDRITAAAAPIRLSISRSILPSLVNKAKILKLLHLRKELPSNLEGVSHLFLVENHGLRFGGADPHPSRFTLSFKMPQCMLQKEKEQLAALKQHHQDEIEHHKKEIERLQREIDRHKGKIR
ncbi:hypothetical protein QTP86_023223, partial [Hemibagrus guttatus]